MVILLGLILPLRVLITWLKLLLVVTLLAWFLVGILRMDMILLLFLALFRIPPMFGLMVVLSLIRLLVFPPPVLDSLLIILPLFGMVVPGGRLIIFTLLVIFRLVGVSALFLGLVSLFKELRCGCYSGFTIFRCCSLGC